MQQLGPSLWREALLLSQVSSQFLQETKEGPEMKVKTHCHPIHHSTGLGGGRLATAEDVARQHLSVV